MKITLNKSISTLAVSMIMMKAPLIHWLDPVMPGSNTSRAGIMTPHLVSQKAVLLVADEENTARMNAHEATGADDPVSEPQPGTATDKNVPSAKSKTAPLRPFKPSEEIAAEQAVDFPVDI